MAPVGQTAGNLAPPGAPLMHTRRRPQLRNARSTCPRRQRWPAPPVCGRAASAVAVARPGPRQPPSPSRLLWAVSLSQLPASLYEEVRGVVMPALLMHHAGSSPRAALGVAHMYLLELLLAYFIGRFCRARQALSLGKMLLVAGMLNLAGLVAMVLSLGSGTFALQVYVFGHVTYVLGATVRDSAFPMLATCFPEEHMARLNAHRHVLMHAGALLGGMMIAVGMARSYLLLQVGVMAVSLGPVARAIPCLNAFDCGSLRQAPATSAPCWRFGLLAAGRFFQSWGLVSASGTVMLAFLRARMPVGLLGGQSAAGLLASAGVVGHVAGLLVNLALGRCRWAQQGGAGLLIISAVAFAFALLCCSEVVGTPMQYLAIMLLLRGARALGKASSDVLALRAARQLGPGRAAALAARRAAFKAGQLVGRYSLAPLLAVAGGDEESSFRMVFVAGAAASLTGAVCHLLALHLMRESGTTACVIACTSPV